MNHNTDTKETSRLEMFSDGVFAIAITLLILEIKVPPVDSIHSAGDLWNSLLRLWPSYFAFFLSFGTILVGWMNHHQTFNAIDKSSRPFMYANGFLLLTITFLPFSTALLAEYVTTDYAQPAIVFYCINGVLQNLGWNLVIISIFKPRLLVRNEYYKTTMQGIGKSTSYALLIYIVTAILAWWFPFVALSITISLWLLWIIISLRDRDAEST